MKMLGNKMNPSDPLHCRIYKALQNIRGNTMESSEDIENKEVLGNDKNLDSSLKSEDFDGEDDLSIKSKNLKEIMEKLQSRIRDAVVGNCKLSDREKENMKSESIKTHEGSKEEFEDRSCNVDRVDYLKEINEKLEKLSILEGMDNSKIEETLNQILEKINILIEKNDAFSSKLETVVKEIDKVIKKLDDISEKTLKLYESGSITVLDVINLIRDISSGIKEIKEILSSNNYEEIDKAIEIADNLNDKVDIYLKEFEKISNEVSA